MGSGLLEVIAPPAEFYPDLDNLKLTFGDDKERVRFVVETFHRVHIFC